MVPTQRNKKYSRWRILRLCWSDHYIYVYSSILYHIYIYDTYMYQLKTKTKKKHYLKSHYISFRKKPERALNRLHQSRNKFLFFLSVQYPFLCIVYFCKPRPLDYVSHSRDRQLWQWWYTARSLQAYCYVILSKTLNHPGPLFPHLWNGYDKSTYFTG